MIFFEVAQLWYLYGVNSIEVRTYFTFENVLWSFLTMKKVEAGRYEFCCYSNYILATKLRDLFDHQKLER